MTKTGTCLLLLTSFAASAPGANGPSETEPLVALAVDFCGGFVGERPDALESASSRLTGLRLSAARPLKEWTADEHAYNGIRAALLNELDDPMRFAAFEDAPSLDSKPGAMFTVDGSACSASGSSGHDDFSAIASRMDADKRWNPETRGEKPRTATWSRTNAEGSEIVFTVFNEGALTFNRVVAKSPPATATAVHPLVQAVTEQCVNGVLDGSDMSVDAFTQFYPYRRSDIEGHVAQLRTYSAFPRAMLNASSFRKEFYCELALGTGTAPAQDLRAAMVAVLDGLAGVTRKSDQEWRVKRAGAKHTAQIKTEVDPRGLVLLQIKTLGGHM